MHADRQTDRQTDTHTHTHIHTHTNSTLLQLDIKRERRRGGVEAREGKFHS